MPQSSAPTSTRRYSVCTQNETSRPLERRTQVDIPGGEANVTSNAASINSRIDQQRSTPVRRLPPARIVLRVSRGDVLGLDVLWRRLVRTTSLKAAEPLCSEQEISGDDEEPPAPASLCCDALQHYRRSSEWPPR